MSHNPTETREQQFRRLIDEALANSSGYEPNSSLDHWYCRGLLTELLVYSAVDKMEVREHLRTLRERPINKPRT